MRIGVLTSSRADYSIYFPLLKKLRSDTFFTLSIIAFGTHLSERHGYTLSRIVEDGFEVWKTIDSLPADDSPKSIASSMGKTITHFSPLWSEGQFDFVLCLGDRYEMFAACASGVPFNIKFAHIHGGEETLGAIDEVFRHSITHMAHLHFTAAEPYRKRVIQLKGSKKNVFNTGALSIDNLKSLDLFTIDEFESRFNIDLSQPAILITFHPETVSYRKNQEYVIELISALKEVKEYQFIITMPNADTTGNTIRSYLETFIRDTTHAYGVESFGTLGYLSCMKHCSFMMGNTSSGFIEAAFFPKYVINLGDRQKGRIVTGNIVNCPIRKESILEAIRNFPKFRLPGAIELYGEGNAADKIIKLLKDTHD